MVIDKIPCLYALSSGLTITPSSDQDNFITIIKCSPPKNIFVYDLNKYDICDIVAGEDFAIFVNRAGNCYLLADGIEDKSKKWKVWMGLEDVELNGKDAVLIPFTVEDPIEMVFAHSFCVLVNRHGQVYYFPEYDNNNTIGSQPTLLSKLSMDLFGGERIVHCGLGNEHALFLTESGKVFGSGANSSGQLANAKWYSDQKFVQLPTDHIPDKIVKVFATYNTSFVLTENNEVWSCGDTTYNASGHKANQNNKTTELVKIPIDEKIVDIEPGLFFVAFKTIGDKYLVFGYNNFSQFGRSETLAERIDGPHPLDTFPNENIQKIVCGGYNSIIISQDRKYYSAGWTIDAPFYPSKENFYNLIDMQRFLGIRRPFTDSSVELCATMGRYFSIFFSRDSARRPLNFKKSFKICDILIKTQNGGDVVGQEEYSNFMYSSD
ncbi:predicted protein [Naegleria gruberi]|uniref:Predicted protein n=1 Tax=Naegleria gruberi TaxID=5762 RepID=D2VUJ8_NAEGR|nr:uncharacterized protein NAEGRDRAFT_72688 [Naegleria gruberi]EFC39463.1 predicted protein [Naegleria gruberi]|eukprot:XP_002672207.1 predicted protein [Naegleria gruberi strain NEG-M]